MLVKIRAPKSGRDIDRLYRGHAASAGGRDALLEFAHLAVEGGLDVWPATLRRNERQRLAIERAVLWMKLPNLMVVKFGGEYFVSVPNNGQGQRPNSPAVHWA